VRFLLAYCSSLMHHCLVTLPFSLSLAPFLSQKWELRSFQNKPDSVGASLLYQMIPQFDVICKLNKGVLILHNSFEDDNLLIPVSVTKKHYS